MRYTIIIAAAALLSVTSCSNKETVTNKDSSLSTTKASDTTSLNSKNVEGNNISSSTAVNLTNSQTFISKDGKTKFSAIYDADKGTVVVKNETTGKTYNMTNAKSADGARFEDKDGNSFWTHQNEFYFGTNDKITIEGTEIK